MPANPKYLTKSPWQKVVKLIAGIIGGFIISGLIHTVLSEWTPHKKEIMITAQFSFFLIWSMFMILAYIPKNGWKTAGIYLLIILLLYGSAIIQ